MRIGAILLATVVVAGCISPVMKFGKGKTPRQSQHDIMSDLGPARLQTDASYTGKLETRRIRVWADDAYRTQNVRWQQSFEGPLELTNLVLTSAFGIKLVAEYRAWDRHVPGSRLDDDLIALRERDPGSDVFAVVGLTSSLPLVSATFDELGVANLGGRHLVVRGYADLEERKLYADAFRDLLPEEREPFLQSRREHKTAVVLLHELGHNFGFAHDPEEHTIMSANYSPRATAFSPAARETITRTLDQRRGRGGPAAPADAPAPTPIYVEPEPSGPPVFHITATGDVLLRGKPATDADIDAALRTAAETSKHTKIVIQREMNAPSEATTRVVSRARALGMANLSVTTR